VEVWVNRDGFAGQTGRIGGRSGKFASFGFEVDGHENWAGLFVKGRKAGLGDQQIQVRTREGEAVASLLEIDGRIFVGADAIELVGALAIVEFSHDVIDYLDGEFVAIAATYDFRQNVSV